MTLRDAINRILSLAREGNVFVSRHGDQFVLSVPAEQVPYWLRQVPEVQQVGAAGFSRVSVITPDPNISAVPSDWNIAVTYNSYSKELQLTLFPPVTFGEENWLSQHRAVADIAQRVTRMSNEALVGLVYPKAGIYESHDENSVYRVVEISVENPPPAPSQDARAIAFGELLKRESYDSALLHIAMTCPDVITRYVALVGASNVALNLGKVVVTGEGAIEYLTAFAPKARAQLLERKAPELYHVVPTAICTKLFRTIASHNAFRSVAEEYVKHLFGLRVIMFADQLRVTPKFEVIPLEAIADEAQRAQEALARLQQTGKWSASQLEQAIKRAVDVLISARVSYHPAIQIVEAQTIGDSFPRGHGYLATLHYYLLGQRARMTAYTYFSQISPVALPHPEVTGRVATISETIKASLHGAVSQTEMHKFIYFSLFRKRVVFVLDASGSMNPAVDFLNSLTSGLQRIADLPKSWSLVVIYAGEISVHPVGTVVYDAQGNTPLYPALKLAREQEPEVVIVLTDWEHNLDTYRHITASTMVWPAPTVIALSFEHDPPSPPEHVQLYNVPVSRNENYFQMLTKLAGAISEWVIERTKVHVWVDERRIAARVVYGG